MPAIAVTAAPAEAEDVDADLAAFAETAAPAGAITKAEANQNTVASPCAPEMPSAEHDAALVAEGEDADDEAVPALAPPLPLLAEAEEAAAEEASAGEAAPVEGAAASPVETEAEVEAVEVEAGSAGVGTEGEKEIEGVDAE